MDISKQNTFTFSEKFFTQKKELEQKAMITQFIKKIKPVANTGHIIIPREYMTCKVLIYIFDKKNENYIYSKIDTPSLFGTSCHIKIEKQYIGMDALVKIFFS